MKFLRAYISELIISIISLVVYAIVFNNMAIDIQESIMFSTPDSLTYLDVTKWIIGGDVSYGLSIRPVLYPLILLMGTKIAGIYGIWIIQVIMWVITVNLVFISVKKFTKKSVYAFIASLLFISNISLIALTLHALTEVTTSFLLAGLTFFIISRFDKRLDIIYIHGIIVFLVLLTILKPVFFILLLIVLIIILPAFFIKKYIKKPRELIILVLILFPVFFQLTIMKMNFREFTISKISSITLTDYFLTQGIMRLEKINRIDARYKARLLTRSEKIDYILSNKMTYFDIYRSNLKENIYAKAPFFSYPKEYQNLNMKSYMEFMNKLYYYIHIGFIFIIGFISIVKYKTKNYKSLIPLIILSSIVAYYILSTGISYLQGDRLILPLISIWPVLYVISAFSLISLINSWWNIGKSIDTLH